MPRLVGVEINGGLGNQLFQYAAGLAIARRQNAELRLNTAVYRRTDERKLLLDRFGVAWTECAHPESRGALRVMARAIHNPFRDAVYRETRFSFERDLFEARAPAFLIGHFQSWRYFAEIEGEIRRILDPARFSSAKTASVEAAIRNATNPVMVHVRRGDYASNPDALRLHGLMDRDYYDRARSAIEERRGPATYFVFTDDPADVRSLLGHWPGTTFVTGFSDLEDLMLMSRCQDWIVANSTFSWWAAWLGRTSADRLAIAPKRWFAPGTDNATDTSDLCPPDWLGI